MLYKELLEVVRQDLLDWDWKLDPEYMMDQETGEAILKLLERRENRNKFYRDNYKANGEKRRNYQREYVAKKRMKLNG